MDRVLRTLLVFLISTAGVAIAWAEGYFDHRLRPDERGTQFSAKLNYIRQNPVAAGLCTRAEDWPWLIDPFASRRWIHLSSRRCLLDSPKAQISGGKAACLNQHVEDNAFHLGH